MIHVGGPAPHLAERAAMSWAATGAAAGGSGFNEILPGCCVDLVFRFSESGCRLALVGPSSQRAAIEVEGGSDYVGLRFLPGQTPLLADASPTELIDQAVDLDTLGGIPIEAIAERLLSLHDPKSRLHFIQSLIPHDTTLAKDERFRQAAMLLERSGGTMRMDELAAGMGIHVRTLERLFRNHLGISPKRAARLMRLNRLFQRLRSGYHGSLADLALVHGYTDQAHMAKDLKELAGLSARQITPAHTGRIKGEPTHAVVHRCKSKNEPVAFLQDHGGGSLHHPGQPQF